MGRFRFAMALSLLSITIAEFATGSTPLTNIILDPGSFFIFSIPSLFGLYGCGVILIREASVAWNKGWPTILMLGIAYGIMEEGVSVHTFFAPVNVTVGVLGEYGKIFGLNLTWAIMISIFHAVFSISLPIFLGNRLWPETRCKQILTRSTLTLVFALYVLTVFILNLIAPYRPATSFTILLVIVAVILALISKKLPRTVFTSHGHSEGVKRFVILGLFFFPFILLFSTNQRFLPPWIVDLELIVGAILIYWQFESHYEGNEARKGSYMVGSLLAPVLAFGVAESLIRNPLGLAAVAALIYIIYRIIKLSKGVSVSPALSV